MYWHGGIFMASSMKSGHHLGLEFLMNSEIYKNTRFENIEDVFNITLFFFWKKKIPKKFWMWELFVLDKIRTSAMRVIHITVKTEETQRLRVKFVLYCLTWGFNLKIERTHFCRKQNSQMFNANWNIHHNHGRDQHGSTIKRSNGRKQKLVSTLIPFYVLVWWNRVQSSRKKMEKPSWGSQYVSSYQDVVGIDGEAIKFEMQISQKPRKCWKRRPSKERTSKTGSSSCQCSMTFCGKQMMRIASRTLRKSRITRRNSYQDTEHFWVQGRKRYGMATLTMNQDSEIAQPTKWYSNSKKLFILSSQVPASCDNPKLLQNSTWWWRRMVKIYSRYDYGTNHWSSYRENSWRVWNRVSIPTICRPKDTSYVVFSRENERFVNEIHKHKAEVKSSVNCSDIFKNQTNESYE